ncbi:early boundary activity protein 2-like isoform X2 [Engraulis encrasicolus]|uniref:early boundary activity protein 2-like isoform X2 n=1 Tax=Engraulis encrasicolus TaxID=184585 RepID=UPI002FCF167E
MYVLIEWVEDPPSWDVVPLNKILNGICEVGYVCDVQYQEESSPAKVLQKGSRVKLMKVLVEMERRRNAGNAVPESDRGRGCRDKRPPAQYSPASSEDDEVESIPPPKKKKKNLSKARSLQFLHEYSQGQELSGDMSPASPQSPAPPQSSDNILQLKDQLNEQRELLVQMMAKIDNLERIVRENIQLQASSPPSRGSAPSPIPPPPPPPTPPPPPPTTTTTTNPTSTNATTSPSLVQIGPATQITASQYAHIKWNDPRKATKDLMLAAFGRQVLATHSYTGKSSNAFPGRDPKPQLNSAVTADIINYITTKFGAEVQAVKQAMAQKCSDEAKMARRRST